MTASRNAALVLSFALFISVFSYGVAAVKQEAGSSYVQAAPGSSAAEGISLFSDKPFPTKLYIEVSGDGSDLLSFPAYLDLQANGTASLGVNVSVPSSHGLGTVKPRLKITESQQSTGTGYVVLQEIFRDLTVNVVQPAEADDSDAGDQISDSTQSASAVSDSNVQATDASAGQEAGQTTLDQSLQSERGWIADKIVCIPESTNRDCGKRVCAEITVSDFYKANYRIYGNERACREQIDKEEKRGTKPRRTAKGIESLRDSARSVTETPADRHEFELIKGDLRKLEIELSSKSQDVKIVVDTLSVSRLESKQGDSGKTEEFVRDETTERGVVNTPATIVPDEQVSEEEAKIEVGGVQLPDIERQTVKDEVVGETGKGEVVRKITKRKAYKYLEIDVEGAASSDVKKATIEFSVEKSWVARNGVSDASLVRLNRFVDGQWKELATALMSEDSDNYYFSAESEGFSFFVITAAITADITTPISIDVPEESSLQQTEAGDFASDLLGTSKPTPLLTLNISWIFVVIILGIVILVKWNDIKRAMGWLHAKEDRMRQMEADKARYEKMKEETTKKYYKRMISEDEFKTLIMEYDKNIISIETQIGEMKSGKK